MAELLPFLGQPITQFFGLMAVIWILQRTGVDVGAIFRAFLRIDKTPVQEINADNRNVMQTLLSQMEVLTTHFNHDTTTLLTEIRDGQVALKDCIKKSNTTLAEFKEYGIKVRKDG